MQSIACFHAQPTLVQNSNCARQVLAHYRTMYIIIFKNAIFNMQYMQYYLKINFAKEKLKKHLSILSSINACGLWNNMLPQYRALGFGRSLSPKGRRSLHKLITSAAPLKMNAQNTKRAWNCFALKTVVISVPIFHSRN